MAVKAPEPESTVNPEKLPASRLATYRNLPEGSRVTQFGPLPTGTALPIEVRPPEESTEYPLIEALLRLAT